MLCSTPPAIAADRSTSRNRSRGSRRRQIAGSRRKRRPNHWASYLVGAPPADRDGWGPQVVRSIGNGSIMKSASFRRGASSSFASRRAAMIQSSSSARLDVAADQAPVAPLFVRPQHEHVGGADAESHHDVRDARSTLLHFGDVSHRLSKIVFAPPTSGGRPRSASAGGRVGEPRGEGGSIEVEDDVAEALGAEAIEPIDELRTLLRREQPPELALEEPQHRAEPSLEPPLEPLLPRLGTFAAAALRAQARCRTSPLPPWRSPFRSLARTRCPAKVAREAPRFRHAPPRCGAESARGRPWRARAWHRSRGVGGAASHACWAARTPRRRSIRTPRPRRTRRAATRGGGQARTAGSRSADARPR
jgi:hypothetical protein